MTPADRWLRRLSTFANHGRLWLAVAVVLGARKGQLRRGAIRGIGSMLFSSALVNLVLKRLFGRVRPDLENLQVHRRLRREPGTLSFPSGHSSSASAFVTGLAMESPLAGAALAPVALGVGYSRVHVGVHYPGDVVAGVGVGGAGGAARPHPGGGGGGGGGPAPGGLPGPAPAPGGGGGGAGGPPPGPRGARPPPGHPPPA